MTYIREILTAIKLGITIPERKCPVCGGTLYAYMYGLPREGIRELLKVNGVKYVNGGCMCFMDDRDPDTYCDSCYTEFNKKGKPIELVTCPLEASGAIFKNECRNYDLLEKKKKYRLLEERGMICNQICPHIHKKVEILTAAGEKFEGELIRSLDNSYKNEANTVNLETKKDDWRWEYTEIPIKEIIEVKELPCPTEKIEQTLDKKRTLVNETDYDWDEFFKDIVPPIQKH